MKVELPVVPSVSRKPEWLKVRAPGGPRYLRLRRQLREWNLHTVCEEARCPNIGECWEDATATFMILGDVCTRNCGYCAITHGTPVWEDREEPERIGRAVADLDLDYVVITSVNRDDLADGGAAHWAASIRAVRRLAPRCRVEVLIPDFLGLAASLRTVVDAAPHVLNHNTETVPRLYKLARHGGRYERTLELFRRARQWAPEMPRKSGIILGLGEEPDEVVATMRDLRGVGVELLTLGQYLRPSAAHLPVARYWRPQEFAELAAIGHDLGFAHVESGPLVRSSYHAKRQAQTAEATRAAGGESRSAAGSPGRSERVGVWGPSLGPQSGQSSAAGSPGRSERVGVWGPSLGPQSGQSSAAGSPGRSGLGGHVAAPQHD
ncbi:MAG: lipoyl synthase [Candidatus Rokubacteria bacterium]|nr:lipoyl synthase [Candidatus Rokubacteria bacterium]